MPAAQGLSTGQWVAVGIIFAFGVCVLILAVLGDKIAERLMRRPGGGRKGP